MPEAHTPTSLLEVQALSAGYGETVVIEALSLTLAAGESVSIIGRNGVGKSSLLAAIMGLARHRGGRIVLDGVDISRLSTHRRARAGLGYVPQEREVFASLTVAENLAVAARPGDWNAEQVYAMFPRLKSRRTHRGSQLSGGEQQMLAIGRALMGNPRLLLMDEPSEGLAPVVIEQLSESIRRLRDETALAIVLVEQHVPMALAFSGRTVVMERGQVVYDGASATLAADPKQLDVLFGIVRG